METLARVFTIINAVVILFVVPLLTFLGAHKFFFEPRYEARANRRKYATALYLSCKELSVHLANTLASLKSSDVNIADAMKKIPNNDFHGNAAWFTKDGYYTTITAYKIAAASAWLRIYQNALLLSSYPGSQSFLNELYSRAQSLKLAFSEGTCLWYYYFDAIGERLVEGNAKEPSVLPFAEFCKKYASDSDFRLFFEQVHMYIWFLGNRNPRYLDTVPKVQERLEGLVRFLGGMNLLPGFRVERPETPIGELEEAVTTGWAGRG